ncbi:hypothetical protein THAOC_27592 [Thalassiosira oceanica]|uniref:Uncharacterized protein n=1 Tax=Thalassiosira oceanica TaxID=159749 RepID=K0RL82_THAOC|nr:hypothetical protein THAOC_27592 [Thalassiosira oceanica]|eukprot:EJK53039.1 hypothetical protein THAOC_27592 [Thalassiosira oceanica]
MPTHGQLFPSPPKCEELCEGSAGAGRSGNAAVGRAASSERARRAGGTGGRTAGGAAGHGCTHVPSPDRPRAGEEDGDPRDGRTKAGGPKLLPGDGDGMDGLATEGRGRGPTSNGRESRARVRNAPPGRTRSGDWRGGRSAPRRGGVARGWRPPDEWERDGDRQAHSGEREVRRPGGAPPWAPGTGIGADRTARADGFHSVKRTLSTGDIRPAAGDATINRTERVSRGVKSAGPVGGVDESARRVAAKSPVECRRRGPKSASAPCPFPPSGVSLRGRRRPQGIGVWTPKLPPGTEAGGAARRRKAKNWPPTAELRRFSASFGANPPGKLPTKNQKPRGPWTGRRQTLGLAAWRREPGTTRTTPSLAPPRCLTEETEANDARAS